MAGHIAGYVHAAAAAAAADAPPLFQCEGRATSALEASRRVAALASALSQRMGLQPGDRACIAALATDHNLEALLAVTAAGGVAAPLNWRWGAAEAAGAAQLVGARLLLADAASLRFALALAEACQGGIAALVLLGPPDAYRQDELATAPQGLALAFAEALIGACPGASLALRSAPGGAALIVYTSGTTGKPKGVALSHAALHSQSMAKLLMCGYCATDVYLHAAPLFHVGGLSSALAMLAAGARHVFLPRFDGAALLAAIQRHDVTCFIAVPAMVADLLAAASSACVPTLPSVRRILVGGSGMSPHLQRGLAALCPAATVHAAYGMTEGASSLTFSTLWGPGQGAAGASSSGSLGGPPAGPAGGVFVGRPPPGIELAVYRPPEGSLEAAGMGGRSSSGGGGGGGGGGSAAGCIRLAGEGEVVTRGPHVMLGYWDDDDATAAAQLPGGWMRTGDLGCLHQGRLWLMGRAKDMIKSGGENVHAWEVEQALSSHPAVAISAVVGAADWRLGEAVAAAVLLRPGWRWAGPRCQVLLAPAGGSPAAQASGRAAANAALKAAVAALTPAGGRSLGGQGGQGGEEEQGQQAAGGIRCEDNLLSTLLQRRPPSRPDSSLDRSSSGGGLLEGLQVAPEELQAPRRRHGRLLDAMQQLQGVAAGLEVAAAREQRSGSSGEQADGEAGRSVDGGVLQQHCRAVGLAGFKLPRVFLQCDAAAASSAPPGSGRIVLPINSTGKVVKHLLRLQVEQHMQVASCGALAPSSAGGGGGGGGPPRSRL